jgi:hypothetical protein
MDLGYEHIYSSRPSSGFGFYNPFWVRGMDYGDKLSIILKLIKKLY